MGCADQFYCDAMFWVQAAVALGTGALAFVAWWNDRRRRHEAEASRYGRAAERFLVPVMELIRSIDYQAQTARDNPLRPELRREAEKLDRLLRGSQQHAYKVSQELIQRIWYVKELAFEVVKQVSILQGRLGGILRDIGAQFAQAGNQRELPQVVVYQDGERLVQLDPMQLIEPFLQGLRFEDYLRFACRDFNADQAIRVTIRVGSDKVHDGSDFGSLPEIIYGRMNEEQALAGLPGKFRELRQEVRTAKKELATLLHDYNRKATA